MPVNASASETQGRVPGIYNVTHAMSYARSGSPVIIRKGILYNKGKCCGEVYVIGITGVNTSSNNPNQNNSASCIGSGLCLPNGYLSQVKSIVKKYIPEGASVVLMGHSLGGMVAQQFSADKTMKSRYKILNTLTMGSPFIQKGEGTLYRMCDRADMVPMFSIAGPLNFFCGNVCYESSGKVGEAAHHSYYDSCWEKYDAFGVKNGSHYIISLENIGCN